MGNSNNYKRHQLTDGTTITAPELALKLNCAIPTAKCRLTRSKDPKVLFKPVIKSADLKRGNFKKYTLDDGSVWTVPQIAEKTGLTNQAVASRLFITKEAAKVLLPKRRHPAVDTKRVSKEVKQRMYFDPDGFWKIFNKIA